MGSDSYTRLTEKMRLDWDRRIEHDYRFWMSDGVESDTEMWRTGERDLNILLRGYDRGQAKSERVLEIGCGVGRLLRAASKIFAHTIGIDVSSAAVHQARTLLKDCPNTEVILGDGFSLAPVADDSIHLVTSFGAFGNMPLAAMARYLIDANRVLRNGGEFRLQLYLGAEQLHVQEDTLGIRALSTERFVKATSLVGFALEAITELVLPFPVSDEEAGLTASVVCLRKSGPPLIDAEELERVLSSQTEPSAKQEWKGSETEYLMAVARANQHLDAGRVAEARDALEFALDSYQNVDFSVQSILDSLRKMAQKGSSAPNRDSTVQEPVKGSVSVSGKGVYEKNRAFLQERFPELTQAIESARPESLQVLTAKNGMPYLTLGGQPLDQAEKPDRAAEVWVEQTFRSPRMRQASHILLIGCPSPYALRALLKAFKGTVHIAEPDLSVLKVALESFDWTVEFAQVKTFSTTVEAIQDEILGIEGVDNLEILTPPLSLVRCRTFVDSVRALVVGQRGLSMLRPNIGLVGPLYGGTLPIFRYMADALGQLRQRVHPLDFSAYVGGYRELFRLVRDQMRISSLEGNFVELLSQIVLESVSERPIDILISVAQAPLSPRVLTELRSRGIITVQWFMEDCRRFTTWQQVAPYYDFFFIIQKDPFLEQVQKAGAASVRYLPVGCDPHVHQPLALTGEERSRWGSELSFLGAGYNNRVQMFATLANRDFKIWGTEWPNGRPFDRLVQERGRRITPEEYVKIFNASTINLNLHSSSERDGVEPFGDFVNPRTFELAASGAFQLVDTRSLLPEMFVPGKEVVTFSDRRELLEKIDFYLAHPGERARISAAARDRALREHTYEHRMKQMLEHIYAERFEELQSRREASPWPRVWEKAEPFPDLESRFRTVYERGDDPTLDALVADIQTGKGALTNVEQRLLFLHHIKGQTEFVNHLREGKGAPPP